MKLSLHSLLLALTLWSMLPAAHADRDVWADGLSLTIGGGSHLDVYRIGMQKRWNHSWFKGGAWYLGGYWDTELALMEADRGESDNVYGISLTPVLRYQRDARLSSGVTPFAEAGMGPHLLSETQLGTSNLATAFQVGSLLGLGLGFGDKGQYELTYRYSHVSNLGIKEPNDDLDLHLVKLGYSFN
jgi:lipid A 3-O-deacylase